jgi:hypothetical protein
VSDEQDISTDLDQSAPAGSDGTVRVFIPGDGTGPGIVSPLMEKKREGQVTTVPVEIGGRNGPDPTRFGDWELKGRCIDF